MKQLRIEKQITKRESQSIISYLQEVSKYSMVTPAEEVKLAKRIKKGDDAALEKLVKANLRFVISVAKQYQHMGVPLEDLINEGNSGLVIAARRFDETRGFKFISYAVWWIRQAILKAAIDYERQIRLPNSQVSRLSEIRKLQSKLEQELEREPTQEELADTLELTSDAVDLTLTAAANPASMDKKLDDGESSTLADLLENKSTPETDKGLLDESLQKEMKRTLKTLPHKERMILELYFGIGQVQAMTVKQVANKCGIPAGSVGRIKDRALKRLRESGQTVHLKNYLRA